MSLKLSIIIPCYNCEKTLEEAVVSCYKQGFSDKEFEIVMVDDGSNDGTYSLLEKLSKEHTNINIFQHPKNQGGGATRNTAVSHTKAEVIFCLDSDDILPVGTLKKLFDYLQTNQCDGAGIHYSIKFKGTDLANIDHIVTMSYVGQPIPFTNLFQLDGEMCSIYHVFLFTKSAFNKAGGYPTEHGFDTQGFAWRFLGAGLVAHTVPETFYLLRVGLHESYYLREYNQGLVNFNWQKIFAEFSDVFSDEARQFIENFNCSDVTRNLFEELRQQPSLLRTDYQSLLDNDIKNKIPLKLSADTPTPRKSLKGLLQRVTKKKSGGQSLLKVTYKYIKE